ncbi:MAG: DUF423 domain-containing protein [Alphaproteobacteria bacterium]|nr:DUF423 domain-containing protein [Alphaproteobacteria bacterium]MBU0795340.1 DUF423 domain-containing protein [Alphaproteobacteria bacterium]MBU0877460.1 DUF423 domain-containing protein [Alphaproteobacteria bacterium]MBU1770327.1 DUF423 domain-containing protein [Alphaproteobacteria bacterium]
MIAVFAALSAAVAIGASAFGAHAASSPQAAEWLRTGGLYQLIHAVAVLALLRFPVGSGASWALLGGSVLFAATLYAMALGAPRWLGAVTPIGGTIMILGWLWLGWKLARAA